MLRRVVRNIYRSAPLAIYSGLLFVEFTVRFRFWVVAICLKKQELIKV
jgi:hypothetical protein